MKSAFNDANIITRVKRTFVECPNCCFHRKHDVCFNNELRHHTICNNYYTLNTNIDDIFKI